MAIAFRNAGSAEAAAGTVIVSKPSGIVDNDLLVATGVINGGATITSPPSGWTLIHSETSGANTFYTYLKRASSEGSSWTWTLSGFATGTMLASGYSGVDTSTAQDVSATNVAAGIAATTVIPGATTVTNNAWFITAAMQAFGSSGAAFTAPSGFSVDAAATATTTTNTLALGHKAITPAGATGSSTWTTSDSGHLKKGVGVFLRPSGGVDVTAPAVVSRTVNGASLVITYDETLDSAFTPAASAFTVTVNGVARAVSVVVVSGATVTLTLASPVAAGQTVLLSYVP